MLPKKMIQTFDSYLADLGYRFEAVVIDGTALALLGIISRPTRDCDIIEPEIPPDILRAAREFAEKMSQQGDPLQSNWLNNEPSSLADALPENWRRHLQVVYRGESIILRTLDRANLLKTKMFGLCDRGSDIGDCIALHPTADELREALPWLKKQDANPLWPEHVENTITDLGRRLGHGL